MIPSRAIWRGTGIRSRSESTKKQPRHLHQGSAQGQSTALSITKTCRPYYKRGFDRNVDSHAGVSVNVGVARRCIVVTTRVSFRRQERSLEELLPSTETATLSILADNV